MFISLPLTFLLFAGKKSLQDYWPTRSWRTSSPEEQGIDAKQLKQINDSVREELLKISSVLVVRNGTLSLKNTIVGMRAIFALFGQQQKASRPLL